MQSNILALAERVENLTKPDRSVDWAIHLRDGLEGVGAYGDHPRYTGSLDAAMTLVPKHAGVGLSGPHVGGWLCTFEAGAWGKDAIDAKFSPTPALALCAAALRAHAAQPDQEGS